MTKQEVQAILDKSKNKREIGKKLKRLGYHNTRYYKPTNGTNLQEIAKACNEECDEADREKYYLFASLGNYNGYEWIWQKGFPVFCRIHKEIGIMGFAEKSISFFP